MKVGFDFIWREHGLKPREADFVILDGEAEIINTECLFDEASFGFEKVCKVSDVCAVERKGNGKASAFVSCCLRSIVFAGAFSRSVCSFRCESVCDQVVHQAIELVSILAADASFFADGDVTDFIGAGRHELVYGLVACDVGDGTHQCLSCCSGYVVVCFHGMYLRLFCFPKASCLPFGTYIYHSESLY